MNWDGISSHSMCTSTGNHSVQAYAKRSNILCGACPNNSSISIHAVFALATAYLDCKSVKVKTDN